MKKIKIIGMVMLMLALDSWSQTVPLTSKEKTNGWELLFDGTEKSILDNWRTWNKNSNTTGRINNLWTIDSDKNLWLKGGRNGGDIRTVKEYKDYVMEVEYQIDRNQGIFYRANHCGKNIFKNAVEFAIDPGTEELKVYSGAAYAMFPVPVRNAKSKNGVDWDKVIIIAIGDSIEHYQNGIKLVEYRYWSPAWNAAITKGKWKSVPTFGRDCKVVGGKDVITPNSYPAKGYIGVQGTHAGEWRMRNFKVLNNPVFGCTNPLDTSYNSLATYDIKAKTVGDTVTSMCSGVIITSINDQRNKSASYFTLKQDQGSLVVSLVEEKAYSVSLFDIAGNQVSTKEATSKSFTFQGLAEGVYFVKVSDGKNSFAPQRVNFF